MPRKKSATTSKGPSKTAFVLAQSKDLSAKEVSAKAKAAGLDISEGYVYTIRSKSKTTTGAKKGKPGRPKGSKNKAKGSTASAPSIGGSLKQLEESIRDFVIDHGAHAVQAALHAVSAKLRKIV